MPYRVIFDVADRVQDIALGATALLVFAGVGVAALWRLDAVLARWLSVLTAGVGLFALEAGVDRQPLTLGFGVFAFAIGAGSELYNRRVAPAKRQKGLPLGGTGTMLGTFLLVFAMFFGLPMVSATGLSDQLAEGRAEVKRFGWVSVRLFCRLNDLDLRAPAAAAFDLVIAIAEGRARDVPDIADRLRSWTADLEPPDR